MESIIQRFDSDAISMRISTISPTNKRVFLHRVITTCNHMRSFHMTDINDYFAHNAFLVAFSISFMIVGNNIHLLFENTVQQLLFSFCSNNVTVNGVYEPCALWYAVSIN